jgi:long-chain acyl-CoA synthetase
MTGSERGGRAVTGAVGGAAGVAGRWYDERPWLGLYPAGRSPSLTVEHPTALAMFQDAARRAPDRRVLQYFDGSMTMRELDVQSDALASALQEGGFGPGDRLAIYLQNVPQWVVTLVAVWKAGGTVVAVNPMNRERELTYLLQDSGARVLVCHPDLYDSVARPVLPGTAVERVLTTSQLEQQTRDDPRLFAGLARSVPAGTESLADLVEQARGRRPAPVAVGPDDVAVLTYTSGTTGVPKGAMNTQANISFTSQVYRDWVGLDAQDVVLGAAPLFHITGLIGALGVSLLLPATLVLAYRFHPGVVRDVIVESRPTFTIMAITAFGALMNLDGVRREDFQSLRKVYSGGAAIAPAMVEKVRDQLGLDVHVAYGLTETTSPSHLQPLGVPGPVDPTSGALTVGIPVHDTVVRIVDEAGQALPPGEVGEIETEGPQVVPGYWGKPEATAESLPGGRLRTGDVGFMSPEGWFFIVDRKKDMINAAGYKVWPREVEDVLYTHPAVREAAVVGVPDEYRGETVKAYVSARAGATIDPAELIAYCKERMAAYKYPRQLVVLEELPKTVTGKILRRELRGGAPGRPAG